MLTSRALRDLENFAVLRLRQYPNEFFALVLDHPREQPCFLTRLIEAVGRYKCVVILIHQR
jgi:hypothetical protein